MTRLHRPRPAWLTFALCCAVTTTLWRAEEGSALPAAPAVPAPTPAPRLKQAMDLSRGQPASDFLDALASGKFSLDLRLRAEIADQQGLRTSQAYTLRTRFGYTTQAWEGLQFMAEVENVFAYDDDRYNAGGLNMQPTRTVVSDVEGTELNQLWARWAPPIEGFKLEIKPGRQVINLDDQRFVGDAGWRQDNQTFDAVSLTTDVGVQNLTLLYSYLWRINRIFADDLDWESNSHLINLSYDIPKVGKITGFVYLLDFNLDTPTNSSQTFGGRFAGKQPLDDILAIEYQLSVAHQSDYARNPVDYDALYYLVDAGMVVKDFATAGVGYEVLGSDDNRFGFRTPLATLHKFNGYADVFLITPAAGLQDFYVYLKSASLPWSLNGYVAYHHFAGDDRSIFFGHEFDAVLTRKINDYLWVGVKYSQFWGDEPGFADRGRVTVDLTFAF